MIYLDLPTFYRHLAMFNGKVLEDLKAPSGTPMWQLFNDLRLRCFLICRHFPAAVFSDTNCRMSFIPGLVWTQVLQMHLSSTGGAVPHGSGAHGFLIVLRIQKT